MLDQLLCFTSNENRIVNLSLLSCTAPSGSAAGTNCFRLILLMQSLMARLTTQQAQVKSCFSFLSVSSFGASPPWTQLQALQAAMRRQFQSKLLKSVYLTTIASILLKLGTDIDLHPLRMS